MKQKNNFFLDKYFKGYFNLINNIDCLKITQLCEDLTNIKRRNKKVIVFGNGAGAAISSHFTSDLSKTLKIKAFSFDNSAHITCFANDYKFENWISNTLKIFIDKQDLVILLSASGNSKNMLNAAKFLKKRKINFYTLTGFKKNNKLNLISKKKFWIDSNSYNHIEVVQSMILLSSIDLIKNKK